MALNSGPSKHNKKVRYEGAYVFLLESSETEPESPMMMMMMMMMRPGSGSGSGSGWKLKKELF